MFRWHVVSAVFRRNLKQYFTSVLGYLFIVVFVTICAVLTFSPQFFADNLANLDQLSRYFPLLLLFIIPAITMNVWAEEKRSGTDAILFTLPASDFEIVLGKYLAVAAVYTVALAFSAVNLFFLSGMGLPDWGIIASTYAGYWLAGLALLATGMFASSLTGSSTVAFVLGAVFCAIPVLLGEYFRGGSLLEPIDSIARTFGFDWDLADKAWASWLNFDVEKLGFSWNLQDFTVGLIPLSNVVYFLTMIVFMFYLNMAVISRRHWSGSRTTGMTAHFLVRALFLGVGFIALNYLVGTLSSHAPSRFDLTSERLYSLTPTTQKTLKTAREADRRVTIQAFVSEDVPREYANTKKQLLGMLRQFQVQGGPNIDVRLVNVEPYSDKETEARQLGITSKLVTSESGGKKIEQEIFLGAVVGDVVLPMFESAASVEYELTRAVGVTTDENFTVNLGIVETDIHFGSPEIDGRRMRGWPPYMTASELLDRNYEVTHYKMNDLVGLAADLSPVAESGEKSADGDGSDSTGESKKEKQTAPDVLFVPYASSLDPPAMQALVDYIEMGHPVLIIDDPLPFFWPIQNPTMLGVLQAPRIPRVGPQNPYHDFVAASYMPKDDQGRAGKLLDALGIDWDNGSVVWSLDNPHPNFSGNYPPYQDPGQLAATGPYDKSFVWVGTPESDRSWGQFGRTTTTSTTTSYREDGEGNVIPGSVKEIADTGSSIGLNANNRITKGLNEILLLYPGEIKPRPDSQLKFEPIISLGPDSGTTRWEELTMTPMQTMVNRRTGEVTETAASSQLTENDLIILNPNPLTEMDPDTHTIAAQISGGPDNVNVVYIADLDLISEVHVLQARELGSELDNLTLLQNSIDVLAGKFEFVDLRNRRPVPRTLEVIEAGNRKLKSRLEAKEQEAEETKQEELAAFREKITAASEKLRNDDSLSNREKTQQMFQAASDEARRLQIQELKLQEKFDEEVGQMEAEVRRKIALKESAFRVLAVLFAPIPAILLGSIVLGYRWMRERSSLTPDRRV